MKERNRAGLLAGTNHGLSIGFNMDLCSRVPEAHQASRDDWDRIEFVVYSQEIRNLRVKERCPIYIPNAGRSKRDSSDGRTRRQIERHEQRVEFRESSAKRVTDLQIYDQRK